MNNTLYTRDEPALLPYYPRRIFLLLQDMGFSEADIFTNTELSAAQLQDENFRLSIAQHEDFILRALQLTEDPHFAIRLAQQKDTSAANLPLLAVANSGNIAKALHLITRYNKLVTRVFTLQYSETKDRVCMELQPHLQDDRVIYFALSAFVLSLDNFFQDVLDGAHLVDEAQLSLSQPKSFDKVRTQFPFPVSFDHPQTRVFIKQSWLDKPMRQADPQTVRMLMEMSEQQLRDAEAEMSVVGEVKSLLIQHIASPPKLDEAAQQLGVSPRGLRRKLEQSGTRYQKLLDDIRYAMASRLIRDSDSAIASIAYELGFENASDFGRAFKRWSGLSPSAYRVEKAGKH